MAIPSMLVIAKIYGVHFIQSNFYRALYSNPLLSVLRKQLVIGQLNFSSDFLCFSLVTINGKLCMTPVSFVKNTESYEVSLVTISR